MWALTLHWQDLAGDPDPANDDIVRIAMTGALTNPWNPIAGTNWVYDMFPIRATGDHGHGVDTRDGLRWPSMIASAEVWAADGLPIGIGYPSPDPQAWMTLTFETDPIEADADAWVSWNVTSKEPITVAERMLADPEWSNVAEVKSRAYYPEGTFDVDIHDGSDLSLADFLYFFIIPFERGQDGGMIYDTAYTSAFNAFVSTFKGVKFITDETGYDLVVEYWTTNWNLDAEFCVNHMFPTYAQGPGMWHTLALGILGEDAGECAFGQAKAEDPVVWTNYVGEGKLILETHMDAVIGGADVPYEAFIESEYSARTLGVFADEVDARMGNLETWYDAHGHFWVATGPMFLDSISFTPKSLVLKKHQTYHSDGDKWLFLMDIDPTLLGEMGAWVEQVNIEMEPNTAQAISRLQSDDLDIFAYGLSDADLFATVQADANLDYVMSIGSYNELTLNPVGPVVTLEDDSVWFNPFGITEVREAMHWAIDRDYLVGTVMGGLGIARWLGQSTAGSDASRYPTLVADIEAYYAYDFAAADAAIETAMLAVSGVTRDVDGQYYYLAP